MVKLIGIGEVKLAKDGRSFYTAEFQDASNPFAGTVRRNFWQQFADSAAKTNPIWKGADPAITGTFVGKLLPGQILTLEVEAYTIGANTVSTYKTVVLGGELPKQVFKQLGHPVVETVVAAEAPAVEAELPII